MYEASCHCNAVRISVPELPLSLTECNCSVCRRYGARWAYYTRDQVELAADAGALTAYSWGDRTIEFFHCRQCGCLTHYESADRTERSRFALNSRMLAPDVFASLPVRHFDGADSWSYLD